MANSMYIGSIATELKKNIKPAKINKVTTEEETIKRKSKFLDILDKSSTIFLNKLEAGEINISTTADLERIVKLTLLLSGEADSIKGKIDAEEETKTTVFNALNPELDDVSSLLNLENPNVKAVYDAIFKKYNDANDSIE